MADTTVGWRFTNPRMPAGLDDRARPDRGEGRRAYGIIARDQDAFAAESQRRAAAAIAAGVFNDEIVPVAVPRPKGDAVVVAEDEHPRPDTTWTSWPALKPAFTTTERHRHRRQLERHQRRRVGAAAGGGGGRRRLTPLARVVTSAVAGVDPSVMGHRSGPGDAQGARRAGLPIERDRSLGAERGVRRAGAGVHARARPRSGSGQRLRRSDRARPRARLVRLAHPHHAGACAAGASGALRRWPRCASASARALR